LKNLGNLDDLVAHLTCFIGELTRNGQQNMTFCMILWILFLKIARYNDPNLQNMEHWLAKLCKQKQIGEDEMAQEIQLRMGQKVVAHRHPQLLLQVKDKMETFQGKPCVASIAIIDHMVKDLLRHNPSSLKFWQENVVRSLYSTLSETASDFLIRANDFLRLSFDGATLLLEGFEIQSYVAFMRMPRLPAYLLFGYLETCKFGCASSADAAGGRGGRGTLSHGFCTFVSSAGQVFTPVLTASRSLTCLQKAPCAQSSRDSGVWRTCQLQIGKLWAQSRLPVKLFKKSSMLSFSCDR